MNRCGPGYVPHCAGDTEDTLPPEIFEAEKKHINYVEGKPLTGFGHFWRRYSLCVIWPGRNAGIGGQ